MVVVVVFIYDCCGCCCLYRGCRVPAVKRSTDRQTNCRCRDTSATEDDDIVRDYQRQACEWSSVSWSKGRQKQRRMCWALSIIVLLISWAYWWTCLLCAPMWVLGAIRIGPGGCKRRSNLTLVFCLCLIVHCILVCFCCIGLSLFSISQDTDWEVRLRNELFCDRMWRKTSSQGQSRLCDLSVVNGCDWSVVWEVQLLVLIWICVVDCLLSVADLVNGSILTGTSYKGRFICYTVRREKGNID